MKSKLWGLLISTLLTPLTFADTHNATHAPQPTTCIASTFSSTGDQYWKNVTLKLTNNCSTPVDFQNAAINFQTSTELNTSFWGNFSPLAYPDNALRIISQKQADANYLATLNLHFPNYEGAISKLPAGKSISIQYGTAKDGHIDGTVKVYVGDVIATGNIEFTNASLKPVNVSQNYAVVHVTANGQKISDLQLPWNSKETLTGLAAGNYVITADSLNDSSSNVYQASVTPASLNLAMNQTAKVNVIYNLIQQVGKVAIKLPKLPTELTGYAEKPTVTITQANSSSSTSATVNWDAATTISQLKSGSAYSFSTPEINFKGYDCTPAFAPLTLVASDAVNVPTTNLAYTCKQVGLNSVTFNVNGAPSSLNSLQITLTPNNNSGAVTKTIPLSNGSGTTTVQLPNGVIYTVSAESVLGYSFNFNPQPFTSIANGIETITLSKGTNPVAVNGQLKVCGTQLCNQNGQPIQLKGMSSHGLQWYGWNKCLTGASLDALANNFGANVIRVALYVQEGGYDTNPSGYTNQVNLLINEANKRGMYVIVDWHILNPGDPNVNFSKAQKFFTDIANANKDKVNMLYEIANEPNGVSWSTIKNYAEKLIPIIRAVDPKTPIIIGTPGWSSLGISDGITSQQIINQPVNATNIMYTFHFYAVSHREEYLNELDKASNAIPVFITEWGSQNYEGNGANDFAMTDKYMELAARKKIGWTNWNYSDDFRSGAIWKEGTCSNGQWTDSNLKPAGTYVKSKIKS